MIVITGFVVDDIGMKWEIGSNAPARTRVALVRLGGKTFGTVGLKTCSIV